MAYLWQSLLSVCYLHLCWISWQGPDCECYLHHLPMLSFFVQAGTPAELSSGAKEADLPQLLTASSWQNIGGGKRAFYIQIFSWVFRRFWTHKWESRLAAEASWLQNLTKLLAKHSLLPQWQCGTLPAINCCGVCWVLDIIMCVWLHVQITVNAYSQHFLLIDFDLYVYTVIGVDL